MNKTKLTLIFIIIISTVVMMISMRGYKLTKVNVINIYENSVDIQIDDNIYYNNVITLESIKGITKAGETIVKIKHEPLEIKSLNTEKYCVSAIIVSGILMFLTDSLGSKSYMQKISLR